MSNRRPTPLAEHLLANRASQLLRVASHPELYLNTHHAIDAYLDSVAECLGNAIREDRGTGRVGRVADVLASVRTVLDALAKPGPRDPDDGSAGLEPPAVAGPTPPPHRDADGDLWCRDPRCDGSCGLF
ncbi:MAG: hypothetical protein ACRCZD_12780 [Phycicoccus sp.]